MSTARLQQLGGTPRRRVATSPHRPAKDGPSSSRILRRFVPKKYQLCVLTLVVTLLPLIGFCDKVLLESGQVIEGIISRDTEDEVQISFGVGTVTVRRSQVVGIERSSEEERVALQASFEEQRKERKSREPPDEFISLDRRLQRLKKDRAKAKKSVSHVARIDMRKGKLEKRVRNAEKEYRRWSNRLALLSPRKQYADYSTTVEKVNRAGARLNETRAKLRNNDEQKKRLKLKIGTYMEDLAAFEIDLAREVASTRNSKDEVDESATNWFARATAQLDVLRSDYQTMYIPTETQSGSKTVSVLVNDRAAGTFIVDTGASVVTLSASMAKRLGLSYASRRSVQMTLADGSSVPGYPLRLRSVAVGDAKAWNVGAVVIERPPGPGVDGLLGMTFLNRFAMRFNAQTGLLELKTFGTEHR